MRFREKSISKLYAFAMAAVFALVLAGCGGGGGGTAATPDPTPMPEPTPQESCENAGGRYNADGTCTSAAALAQEMIMAAQGAAGMAAAAANTALNAAKAAFGAISGLEGYDELHYNLAAGALDDARRAKQAADAANQAAMDADSPEAAQKAQADAESAQAAAETALANATMFADAVTAAKAEADRLAQEEADRIAAEAAAAQLTADLGAAVTRAMEANAAATMASGSAAAAVATLTATEGATSEQGASAQAAAGRAAAAAAAALSAHANAISAQSDRDLAAANAAADAAEQAQMDAETALGEITAVIAMLNQDNQEAADEAQRVIDVAGARAAAMASVTQANAAAEAAEAAAEMAEADAPGSDAAMAARDAATAARTAADAAQAALDAIADDATKEEADAQAANAATSAGEAQGQESAAIVAAGDAAGLKAAAEAAEEQRVLDVAAARTAAMGSVTAANTAADNAEMAADRAEEIAPNTASAATARAAATAARAAADAAQAALDDIMDDMTKEQADAQATEAATQAAAAQGSYMTASNARDAAETAVQVVEEQQRVRAVADATAAANDARDAAKAASDAADTAADAAETARDNAKAALDRAKAARTDATGAEAQYEAAKMAAMMARTAANNAMQAYMDAKAAADGIDPDGTADDAETAQDTAESKQGEAETAQMTAETQQGMAETAETDAGTAAGTHVLRLFQAANGAHVEDDESTMDVNETADHVASVGAAMAAIAAVANGDQGANTTAGASYPGDTVDNPATETDEFVAGTLSISVDPGRSGTAIPFELRESRDATDLNNDGDTSDDGEAAIIQTARKIADLGVFAGYELWEDDGDSDTTTDRARAIVFTNKQQGDDSVPAVTAVTARSVVGQTVVATELAKVTSTASTITGVEWTPPDEAALTGTLTCGDSCSITLGADGEVTAISGYTFTGSRAAVVGVTAANATDDNDYLAFGIWLDESEDGNTNTIGAFAAGGAGYPVNVQNAVTGTATYSGKAAGAHHKTGEGVNFFDGDANLTANFGAIDTDAERGATPPADTTPGTISGSISNIRVNGGPALSDSIVLRPAALTDATATFNGNARMGAAMVTDTDTVEYPFNGTWSGSFFGATADDPDTADVNESVTAPLAAAGTFGVSKSTGTGEDMVVESFVGAFGAHKQ